MVLLKDRLGRILIVGLGFWVIFSLIFVSSILVREKIPLAGRMVEAGTGAGSAFQTGTSSSPAIEIRFTIGDNRYLVDGKELFMDASPFLSEERSYVPVRYLTDAMGGRVEWEEALQRVTLAFSSQKLELFIGRPVVVVNGEERPIPVAPIIREGRTYLPARFVAEAVGYHVGWDSRRQNVVISMAPDRKLGWADPYSIWVFGRPPLEYLREVGATGTAWSVYFWGRNPEEEAYTRRVQEAGYWVLSNLPSDQGSQWLSAEGWKGLDQALLEAGACRGNDGSIIYYDVGSDKLRIAYMDHNAPPWQNYLENMVKEHIAGGVDGILIDGLQGPAVSVFYGGDFSRETMAAFRNHLARKFSREELLARFGISDILSFDYGRHLAAKGIKNAYNDNNQELRREYLRFMYDSRRSFLKALIRQAKEEGGSNLAIAGNAYQFGPSYQPILPLLDIVFSELPEATLPGGKQAGLYLLAKSIVGHKPVVGFLDTAALAKLSPQDHALWRHWLAEAASAGCTLLLPYEAFTMGAGSFTLPAAEIAPYTRFIQAHPEVYTAEKKSLARVAILYDLASTLWDRNAWQGYLDLTKILEERHFPYDVLFLGDGELATEMVLPEELQRYAAILLPPLHKAQAAEEGLAAYKAGGGKIIRVEPSSLGRLAENLQQMGVRSGLDTDAPPTLSLFPYLTPWGGVVHLVNYDYDYSRHEFRRQTNIRLRLSLPAGIKAEDVAGLTLKLVTPDAKDQSVETILPWTLEGGAITFTVPEVYSYSVAVLGTKK